MTIFDGDITKGWLRERVILKFILGVRIPKLAYEYAKGISKVTGLPLEQVLKSKPVREYIKRLREEVVIHGEIQEK